MHPIQRRYPILLAILLAILAATAPGAAQDSNILMPVDSLEERLTYGEFEVIDRRGSRAEGDRTTRTTLQFPDGTILVTKWAPAPVGGEAFNNAPRFETAAYELQKLFLAPDEYVVPPTVLRAFPLDWYQGLEPRAPATFFRTDAVLVVIQYWLFNVTNEDFWDEGRFERDTAYAHHFGNFNILTYLIEHADENVGNYLISQDSTRPRVFSVDNGVAFSSDRSDRGDHWRRLRVDRVPSATIARLRSLDYDQVEERMETFAQFRILPDGTLQRMPRGRKLQDGRGIRRKDGLIQIGLTRREIREVWSRIEDLLEDVDRGDVLVF